MVWFQHDVEYGILCAGHQAVAYVLYFRKLTAAANAANPLYLLYVFCAACALRLFPCYLRVLRFSRAWRHSLTPSSRSSLRFVAGLVAEAPTRCTVVNLRCRRRQTVLFSSIWGRGDGEVGCAKVFHCRRCWGSEAPKFRTVVIFRSSRRQRSRAPKAVMSSI